MFTAVTGVSGSGKSTLVNEILYKALANKLNRARMRPGAHKRLKGLEHLDKIISVDQSPIGRTPRSNPATYIGLFDIIRDLYSKTQESRARGYKAGRFSFNVKGGRCEVCRGDGQIKIEMHFLPDIYVPCEQCHGKRYNKETLDIRFKGKTIADVLDMPVEEALEFFAHIPKIARRLQTLHDVGLDYMRLGQPATTLSGGEAQRIKLASELAKVATGRTLYILDEPTTGLHFADIQKLLEVLQRLVDAGNSVVVIEHNLDVIKTADRIIDMGPEGGEEGGTLMADRHPRGGREGRGVLHRPLHARAHQAHAQGQARGPQARSAQGRRGRLERERPPRRAVYALLSADAARTFSAISRAGALALIGARCLTFVPRTGAERKPPHPRNAKDRLGGRSTHCYRQTRREPLARFHELARWRSPAGPRGSARAGMVAPASARGDGGLGGGFGDARALRAQDHHGEDERGQHEGRGRRRRPVRSRDAARSARSGTRPSRRSSWPRATRRRGRGSSAGSPRRPSRARERTRTSS